MDSSGGTNTNAYHDHRPRNRFDLSYNEYCSLLQTVRDMKSEFVVNTAASRRRYYRRRNAYSSNSRVEPGLWQGWPPRRAVEDSSSEEDTNVDSVRGPEMRLAPYRRRRLPPTPSRSAESNVADPGDASANRGPSNRRSRADTAENKSRRGHRLAMTRNRMEISTRSRANANANLPPKRPLIESVFHPMRKWHSIAGRHPACPVCRFFAHHDDLFPDNVPEADFAAVLDQWSCPQFPCQAPLHRPITKAWKNTPWPPHDPDWRSPHKGLDGPITRPFTNLMRGTWLHDRCRKDVYTLLIDAFRLRSDDMVEAQGRFDAEGIYAGRPNSLNAFRRFLSLFEMPAAAPRRYRLLPAWWDAQAREECEALVLDEKHPHNLYSAFTRGDVLWVFGDLSFPTQLRLFGDAVYGTSIVGRAWDVDLEVALRMESQAPDQMPCLSTVVPDSEEVEDKGRGVVGTRQRPAWRVW
ncbi:hypothetical protein SODALDRAFT_322981 [Sodiomyces alkalinus F11]|uniref:Uncharacterized protein n=1 Tax=Sodiomyces alkalinus (strain CBS 110278 / VKM F-3762 / F11) TaxID=1314773 RepID=A0A3N2PYJ9_SODAK|nr:hypothetical protein SODALDRAFT_322981 [Sodiomyces alkalinus F11]ROT39609.1 hypothetical protein SODALDRAFT_322981 [Sodiomyces alkalinus F11]